MGIVNGNLASWEMSKKAEDYGLPPLTFKRAAEALGISDADFTRWMLEDVKPSPSRWTEWTKPEGEKGWRPLPERLLRRYLTDHGGARAATPLEKLVDSDVIALVRSRWGAEVAEGLEGLIAAAAPLRRKSRRAAR